MNDCEVRRASLAGGISAGPDFIDRQGTALEILAVQPGNGLVGLFLVRHLDEPETAGNVPHVDVRPSK